ncbi:Golgi to ER traffic protein 1 [Yarrowia lipolytica]|uniref:Golgi to ER traffic protein 1 n=2 Tax=Yarrowia lipolytica TaxID=4952 RepID=GET1_YARLI|nr:YALI0E20889p [Yarrowia lipolytica CLIB122]Q6C555.1 RecName: Full=Golgi to ER traffic protein 1; AltName: Full=Guided entry of tail-anchored proteins 1 [Yarrowia lipolytica CLIB122]RDW28209.1 Golgi to ER traffic protein 1 [Yarrowia lipolytica]RDW35505.1 Golgi to ER traffic protein 1 [Yarrowia lipolytica]RDW40114.1 Golgi to ER traffic protein 1 [Yarrowia lipolytica]RDW49142.1 Golgi to ER traffic protein 1 [Yarrowia lipolytica]RDW55968.1 Golgi to ER traffic protein 1 [Yarrowia lipolytica]|eukprot:XP_504207.1 YALI0E20889p [Yarrowia lipolytica CLIB122]
MDEAIIVDAEFVAPVGTTAGEFVPIDRAPAAGLLLLVAFVVLYAKVISKLGKPAIQEFLWEIITRIVPSKQLRRRKEAQLRAIEVHTQRSNTSSQDQFAKWAKLDREYGKLKVEIEDINNLLTASKARFFTIISSAIFLSTTGMKMFLRIKHRKAAIFWLPKNAFPYPIEYILSFSSAPLGSVSVSAWLMICDAAMDLIVTIFVALVVGVIGMLRSNKVKPKTA